MTRRKDGLYQEAITINGKRKYFYGHSKQEVLKKIREYKDEIEKGPTVSSVADQWYDDHIQGLRYKTIESYARPLVEIRDHFGSMPVTDITPPMITSFIRRMERQGYARRTVQLRLDILRMLFGYAVSDLGIIQVNPVDEVHLSKGLPKEKRELAPREDIQKIVEHRNDDRFSLLPFLLMWTGMRLCEALALTDKSFHDGFISVEHQLSWEPNKPVLAPVKTERGVRQIPLLDILTYSLPKFKGYLFSMAGDGKEPLSKSAFTKRWNAYARRTGVTCIRHVLRHEFATVLFDADIDEKDAADIMGHDENVMRQIYTHIRDERKKITADKLNSFVNMM